ncbi:hypothetical protein LINPERHAP1_LOCUS23106 [Linum perenne]
MYRSKGCPLVLLYFGLWFVFGETQRYMLRHETYSSLLTHDKDSQVFSLVGGLQMLTKSSCMFDLHFFFM